MTHVPALGLRRRTGVLLAGLAILGAGLAGCTSSPGAATGQSMQNVAHGNTLDQKLPPAAARVRLVDQDGRRFTLASLRGKVVVLAPMLTMCQETCPMTSENMHRAAEDARRGGSAGRVVFLEVSVDPARDTVPRLHAYARLFGATPGWRLATGSSAAVGTLWKALGVSTDKSPTHETVRDWLTGKRLAHPYDVHHQDVVVVIDPAGRLRWITVGHPDARGTRLPTTMQQFLSEEGRHNLAHPNDGGATSWTARDIDEAVSYVRGLDGG